MLKARGGLATLRRGCAASKLANAKSTLLMVLGRCSTEATCAEADEGSAGAEVGYPSRMVAVQEGEWQHGRV